MTTIPTLEHVDVLPRGRHHLTREEVRGTQRARILVGMVEAVADKGYARATVGDALRRARASRETFYQLFRDKEDCFVAAYDLVVDSLLQQVSTAVGWPTEPSGWSSGGPGAGGLGAGGPGTLATAVGSFLDALAGRPSFARTFLVEVYGAGPRALQRRCAVYRRFTDEVARMVAGEPLAALPPDRRVAVEGFVAATSAMVTMKVAGGDGPGVVALLTDLLSLAWQLGLVAP